MTSNNHNQGAGERNYKKKNADTINILVAFSDDIQGAGERARILMLCLIKWYFLFCDSICADKMGFIGYSTSVSSSDSIQNLSDK